MAEFPYTGEQEIDEDTIAPYVASAKKMSTLSRDAIALLATIYTAQLERKFPHLTVTVSVDNKGRLHYTMRPKQA
jgi:hypothetical protein